MLSVLQDGRLHSRPEGLENFRGVRRGGRDFDILKNKKNEHFQKIIEVLAEENGDAQKKSAAEWLLLLLAADRFLQEKGRCAENYNFLIL